MFVYKHIHTYTYKTTLRVIRRIGGGGIASPKDAPRKHKRIHKRIFTCIHWTAIHFVILLVLTVFFVVVVLLVLRVVLVLVLMLLHTQKETRMV